MKYIVSILFLLISYTANAISTPREVDNAYNSGNYVLAETLLIDVMQEYPTAKAHYRLGEVYVQQNRHKKAIDEFNKAISLDPSLSFVKNKTEFTSLLASEQSKLVAEATARPVVGLSVKEQEHRYALTWAVIISMVLCILFLLYLYANIVNQKNDN